MDVPTADDIKKFEERFGWTPEFSEPILNAAKCRNEAISHAKNPWILFMDADERVTWDIKAVKSLMRKCDQISCDFVHAHDGDGNPLMKFPITKLFRKDNEYIGRVHETVTPKGRVAYTDKIVIDHYQKPGHAQSQVLGALEYSAITDDDLRSKFYLAREYYYRKEHDKAIKIFDEYLSKAFWLTEITEAFFYKAKCYWETDRGDEARRLALEAFRQNPDNKAVAYLLRDLYHEPWKSKWEHIGDNATNHDTLFGCLTR